MAKYGIHVPTGFIAHSVEEAVSQARTMGDGSWVVKAQVHAGGRGKGGGVRLCQSIDDVQSAAQDLLGSHLVTPQTDDKGLPVNILLVEEQSSIAQELYIGMLLDREQERLIVMASSAGGMNIEEVAAVTPEKILKVSIDPVAGLQAYQCRQLAFGLGLTGGQIKTFSRMLQSMYQLYSDKDASLIEINPLIVTDQGELVALDAKINLDDNALYRHSDLAQLQDVSQLDSKEYQAAQHDLNYVTLNGNIGCMVNGAGLAMATMDLIKLEGGEPANFLDVGGGTTADRVAEAFKIILSDSQVKAILVNIFGGIVRCDLIAEGIVSALKDIGSKLPVVVRLQGTNVEQGNQILENCGLDVISAADLADAAKQVVAAAGELKSHS